jgi:predicted RNase H-like HicB family nuclease
MISKRRLVGSRSGSIKLKFVSMQYLVVYEKSDDGSIWARVPDLDGCYSCGETLEEAREHIKEAIALYLEDLKETGKPIPPTQPLKS